jgi:hypothetical protein
MAAAVATRAAPQETQKRAVSGKGVPQFEQNGAMATSLRLHGSSSLSATRYQDRFERLICLELLISGQDFDHKATDGIVISDILDGGIAKGKPPRGKWQNECHIMTCF